MARTILLNINGKGLPCATELLDPVTPQYIADLLSWTAIGARTTESRIHREMASGLSMPVGFKNGTEGSLQVAVNAMITSRSPHHFVGVNADGITSIIKTTGNPDHHIVLRGGGGRPTTGSKTLPERKKPLRMKASHAASWWIAPMTIQGRTTNARSKSPRSAQTIQDGRRSIMGAHARKPLARRSTKLGSQQGVDLRHVDHRFLPRLERYRSSPLWMADSAYHTACLAGC